MWEPQINTKYKTVDKKVRPAAVQVDGAHAQPLLRPTLNPPIEYTPLDWPIPIWELPRPTSARVTPERLATMNFGPKGFLHPDELDAIQKVTLLYGNAFSFERSEKGLLKPEYAEPYQIRTINHTAWKARAIPLPKGKMDEIRDIYQEQLQGGDLELCDGPYVNPHFFVAKKNHTLRKVVDLSNLNAVSIRDANVPPNLTEFCEDLAGRECYGSGDGHSFFDQILLHPDSRPLTAIQTYYGLLQSTRLPQGWTNSPAVAQRISTHIYLNEIPQHIQVFVDDVVFKGPRGNSGNKTLEGTNLRLWFLDYLRVYARGLRLYMEAGLTFSGEKFIAITPRISITGIVVDKHGKHSDPAKVAKLEEWPCPPPNVHSLRGFLGLANYLRPFIAHFATIDAPLRKLLTGRWRWNEDASIAMKALKTAAAKQPILVSIDYHSSEPIVLAVDSSFLAAGWALYQGEVQEGELRKLVQYGSVGFSEVESRYSQPQLELCGVLKAVKHLRHHLYGVFFILEVDAASIRQMINSPDVPNAAMTRWIHYLRLFDLEVRHVPARNHTLPDGLSRTDFDTVEAAEEWPAEKIGLDLRAEDWARDAEKGERNEMEDAEGIKTFGTHETSDELQGQPVEAKTDKTSASKRKQTTANTSSSTKYYQANYNFKGDIVHTIFGARAGTQTAGEGDSGGDLQGQTADASISTEAREGTQMAGEGDSGGDLQGQTADAPITAGARDGTQKAGEGDSGGDLQGQTAEASTTSGARGGTRMAWEGDSSGDLQGQTAEALHIPLAQAYASTLGADTTSSSETTSTDESSGDSEIDSSTDDSDHPTALDTTLYSGKWLDLGTYLHSGCSFPAIKHLPLARRTWVKQRVGKYFVRRGRLYRRVKNGFPLLVIDDKATKQKILREVHEQNGHRGRDAALGLLQRRFWWETLRLDCSEHIASCEPCQKRRHQQTREPMRHAEVPALFERFNMDIVDLGQGVGAKRYMVVARDAFTGWPEARLMTDKTSASVRQFLEEDIMARYGPAIRTILTDNGPENLGEAEWAIKHLGFKHAFSTPYNPEGNAEVERGHAVLVEGLLRAAHDDRERTASYLPYVLWADRITTRRTTGYSPFELVYGMEPTLPMDIEFQTFLLFNWTSIATTAELIAARTRQLKRRMDDLHLAKLRLDHSRAQGRSYADDRNAHRLRGPIPAGQMVIISNPTHAERGQDRWLGPYKVLKQETGGSYKLAELDGTPLHRLVAAKHVRRYFSRAQTRISLQQGHIEPSPVHSSPPPSTTDPQQPTVPVVHPQPSRPIPSVPAAQPTVPLKLPRARMSRPALPHRDIPPTLTIHPQFPVDTRDSGLELPGLPRPAPGSLLRGPQPTHPGQQTPRYINTSIPATIPTHAQSTETHNPSRYPPFPNHLPPLAPPPLPLPYRGPASSAPLQLPPGWILDPIYGAQFRSHS
ncbi:hypothetical protein CF319_g8657 [Tilletia indica]|nr:hypothetical protein CF319_g8657 [Tilletia indica]